MPRSPSGIYSLPASYLATSGQTIRTEQHNPPLEDIAQALTDSLPRNGVAPMTSNMAMGNNKITGLAAGTAETDAVRVGQLSALLRIDGTRAMTADLPFGGFKGVGLAAGSANTDAARIGQVTLKTAATGSAVVPVGTGAQRDGSPATGYLRYNTDTGAFEGYYGAAWGDVTPRAPELTEAQVTNPASAVFGLVSGERLAQASVFSRSFTSAAQSISVAGTLTLAHGLGTAPILFQCFLECTTADLGFSVGDVVPVNANLNAAANASYGQSITYDASNIYLRFGGASPVYQILNKTTGVGEGITIARWRLIVRAFA